MVLLIIIKRERNRRRGCKIITPARFPSSSFSQFAEEICVEWDFIFALFSSMHDSSCVASSSAHFARDNWRKQIQKCLRFADAAYRSAQRKVVFCSPRWRRRRASLSCSLRRHKPICAASAFDIVDEQLRGES